MLRIRSKHVVELYGMLDDQATHEYGIVMEYFKYGSLVDVMDQVLLYRRPRVVHNMPAGEGVVC